jgi:molecular chaperone DnaJ
MEKDYYAVLGLPPGANPSDIRSAYRRLAKRYHPDLHPEDPDGMRLKFAALQEAYEFLLEVHPSRPTVPTPARPRPPPAEEARSIPKDAIFDWGQWVGREGLAEVFDDGFAAASPFGSCRAAHHEGRGDVTGPFPLTLREMLLGGTKQVVLLDEEPCRACQGKGEGSARAVACQGCGGTGRREVTHIQGAWKSVDRCKLCSGRGTVERSECPLCRGKGREIHQDVVQVEIPPGSFAATRLCLRGMGRWDPARRERGDFFLEVGFAEAPEFRRDGQNLRIRMPVPHSLLKEGGRMIVPTASGSTVFTIPAGTSDGGEIDLSQGGFEDGGTSHRGRLTLALHGVTLPPMTATPIPGFLRRMVPTSPGESLVGSWPAFLDSPDQRGFLVLTTGKLLFLAWSGSEGAEVRWSHAVRRLDLQPLEVPPGTPRDRSALWAINVAGRKLYLRVTLRQLESIHRLFRDPGAAVAPVGA